MTKDARSEVVLTLPLWGILSALGAGFLCLVVIWADVRALNESVDELQVTMKNENTSTSSTIADIALLKFRMDAVESDLKRIDERGTK